MQLPRRNLMASCSFSYSLIDKWYGKTYNCIPISRFIKARFFIPHSLWQSLSGTEDIREGCWEVICHEGFEESDHRTEEEDNWAHQDRKTSLGGSAAESLPGHPSLCLPNWCQTPPYPWLVLSFVCFLLSLWCYLIFSSVSQCFYVVPKERMEVSSMQV